LYGLVGGAYVEFTDTKIYTADDGARPVIGYTMAVANQNKAYLFFSEPVWTDPAATVRINSADFASSLVGNPFTLTGLNISAEGAHEAFLEFTNSITEANVIAQETVQAAAANVIFGQPYDPTSTLPNPDPAVYPNVNWDGNLPFPDSSKGMIVSAHSITDVGLGLAHPIWAMDQTTIRDPSRGGLGRITSFDGTEWLQDDDMIIQARIDAAALVGTGIELYYDVGVTDPIRLHNTWVRPIGGDDTAHNENTAARAATFLPPALGALNNFEILANDAEYKDGALVEFILVLDIDPGAGVIWLPCLNFRDKNDPRTAEPWAYMVRDLRQQKGGVTITNNIIDPTQGEKANVHYVTTEAGIVTVQVFTMDGDIVDILYRGRRDAGEYSTTWDGKNRAGTTVARGVFFVSVVGPGINEIRKVLVVKPK
jgi:hypothetical protein